jgi:hypothetical protein
MRQAGGRLVRLAPPARRGRSEPHQTCGSRAVRGEITRGWVTLVIET